MAREHRRHVATGCHWYVLRISCLLCQLINYLRATSVRMCARVKAQRRRRPTQRSSSCVHVSAYSKYVEENDRMCYVGKATHGMPRCWFVHFVQIFQLRVAYALGGSGAARGMQTRVRARSKLIEARFHSPVQNSAACIDFYCDSFRTLNLHEPSTRTTLSNNFSFAAASCDRRRRRSFKLIRLRLCAAKTVSIDFP